MKKTPNHIAIIMDGNRRWARQKGLPLAAGHRQGLEKAEEIARHCKNKGIKIMTLYAFSTENWQRPKKEVSFLMRLFALFLARKIKSLQKEKVRLLIIGDKKRLPSFLQKSAEKAERLTKNNKDRTLIIAISYGGRLEIAEAVKKIIKEKTPADKINEKQIEKRLYTSGIPNPDLIIRTGGQKRLSNFLVWQSAYSELYFSQKYWPDFTEKDLDEALEDFKNRKRNFGK